MAVSTLKEHLQKHEQIIDPVLKNLEDVVFGPKKDDGLCADVREIKAGYVQMRTIGIAILIALIGNIIIGFIK
jgi:hypothetical protein